jgi:hypothetical protein
MHGNHDEVFQYASQRSGSQRYSEQQKVEKLLKVIPRCTNPELIVAKLVVESQRGHNFVDACCGFFSQHEIKKEI